MLDFWLDLFVLFAQSAYFRWLYPVIILGVITAIVYLLAYLFRVFLRR